MASRKRYTTARAVAKSRVIVQAPAQGVWVLTLPVNDGFQDPNQIDEQRGIEYDPEGLEERISQEGITLALWTALQPANLGAWVRSQAARAGGIPALARQLVAMEPDPLRPATDERNMTRKLEEWRQGKYKRATGRNMRRVAFLQVKTSSLRAGVTGLFFIHSGTKSDGDEIYRRFNTDPQEPEDQQALEQTLTNARQPGVDLIDVILAAANRTIPYDVDLLRLHGLHVQVMPGNQRSQKPQGRK